MAWRQALVAEVAVDLEYFLEAADHQPLQIQLGRDAQEELHVERVVVCRKRLRRGAAGYRVHHRRLDLEEAVLGHVVSDRGDHAAAGDEGEARLLVGHQVEVALPVLLLDVGKAVELLGQRPQRFREQADLGTVDGQLAGLGLHQRADRANDIAEVPALEVVVHLLADAVPGDVELDAARKVLDGGETGLAHHALEHDAARDSHLDRQGLQLLAFLGAVKLVEPAGGVLAPEVVGVGLAGVSPFGQLGAPFGEEMVFVGSGRAWWFEVGHGDSCGQIVQRRRIFADFGPWRQRFVETAVARRDVLSPRYRSSSCQ